MKPRPLLFAAVLLLALTACQMADTPAATATLPPASTYTPTPIPATWTPLPTFTPTATPLPTDTLAPSATPTSTPSPTITPTPLPAPILDSKGILMAYIPAGTFEMGDRNGYRELLPVHTVILTQAFYMDVYEVANASYAACVAAGRCRRPSYLGSFTRDEYYNDPDLANYPVIWVDWYQAVAYCAWRGARLPTEAEWEYAARGGLEGKKYPWGNENPVCTAGAVNGANYDACSEKDPVSVGLFAPNGYGLYDMAGNVWEWVSDYIGYYPSETVTDPTGPVYSEYGGRKVLRGGGYDNEISSLSVAERVSNEPWQGHGVGFRCVAPIEGGTP